jgi:hypothetical protein
MNVIPLTQPGRLGRWVRDDRAWLGGALLMNLLLGWNGEDASSLAWLNPLLFVAALIVRTLDARRGERRWHLTGWRGALVVMVIGWTVGMMVELTLAAGGDGLGGMHPDTGPSFILAQGYYIPLAVVTWAVVRRYGLDTRRAFFFAGVLAWWEALTVGVVALISPFFVLAPLLIAYYFSTYALCGMAGLLAVDPGGPATVPPHSITTRRLAVYGVIAGAATWAVFMLWAVVASRIFGFDL